MSKRNSKSMVDSDDDDDEPPAKRSKISNVDPTESRRNSGRNNSKRWDDCNFNQNIYQMYYCLSRLFYSQTMDSTYGNIFNGIPDIIIFLISEYSIGYVFTFDKFKCHENIKLSDNNLVATLSKRDRWSRRVNLNYIMKQGIHFIEFYINKGKKDISIGISSPNGDISRYVGFDEKSYSYTSNEGTLQYNGKENIPWKCNNSKQTKSIPFKEGDIIGMLLDLDQYCLYYFKNNQLLGKAFDVEPYLYVFCISMAYKNNQVTILE